jgi:MFS family permease
LSSIATTSSGHQMLEILVGVGIAGTGFGVVLGVVGRASSDQHRSLALGITTAAGSAGQIIGPPLTQYLLHSMAWQDVFLFYSGLVLLALLSLPFLKAPPKVSKSELEESLSRILNIAVRDPSYILIFVGFFSCGFQLAFITAHFPAFVTEACATIDPSGLLAKMGIRDTAALASCRYLHGQDCVVFVVHSDTYDPRHCSYFFITYRFALARNSASDVRTRGLYLRTEVHGYPVWLSVPVAPDR